MLDRKWCNNGECAECISRCSLDERIPCSPDCNNVTPEGKILISKCMESGCDAFYCLLPPGAETKSADEILDTYGNEIELP